MSRINVVASGAALAITAAVLNSLCAAAVVLWPTEAIAIANSWTHGLDLQTISSTSPLTLGSFLGGSLALAAIGFVTGVLFAWIYNLSAGRLTQG